MGSRSKSRSTNATVPGRQVDPKDPGRRFGRRGSGAERVSFSGALEDSMRETAALVKKSGKSGKRSRNRARRGISDIRVGRALGRAFERAAFSVAPLPRQVRRQIGRGLVKAFEALS